MKARCTCGRVLHVDDEGTDFCACDNFPSNCHCPRTADLIDPEEDDEEA